MAYTAFSILKSKLCIDNFCIPTNDRKSVLEIATKLKDYECVFSFDDASKSIDDFRGMFLDESDFDRIGRKIPLKKPNQCVIELKESKVGPVYV